METFSTTALLDPWYVTGFVDGEGSFTYSRVGRNVVPFFSIKLTAEHVGILESIQEFFGGIGRIYHVLPRAAPTPRSGFTKAARFYRVGRSSELRRVVEHFDQFPLHGTKATSYAIWREMVILKRDFRKAPMELLAGLADQLSAASPRNKTSAP